MNATNPAESAAGASAPEGGADSILDALLPSLDLTTVSGFIVPAQGSPGRLERLLAARRQQAQRQLPPTFDSTVS